jgi:hypothetical protein
MGQQTRKSPAARKHDGALRASSFKIFKDSGRRRLSRLKRSDGRKEYKYGVWSMEREKEWFTQLRRR